MASGSATRPRPVAAPAGRTSAPLEPLAPTSSTAEPRQRAVPGVHAAARRLIERLPRGKLLDVAAGNGAMSHWGRRKGFAVTAMDINRELFEVADLPFVPADLNKNFPLADHSTENARRDNLNITEERDRLFESLYNTVIEISETQPILLVLDDLQWADSGTLRLLHYLARNIRDNRVLLCAAYSPEDIKERHTAMHPLAETVGRMRVEKLFHEINLTRLSREQTRELIESPGDKAGLWKWHSTSLPMRSRR